MIFGERRPPGAALYPKTDGRVTLLGLENPRFLVGSVQLTSGTCTAEGGLNLLGGGCGMVTLVTIEPPVSGPTIASGARPAAYVFMRQKK